MLGRVSLTCTKMNEASPMLNRISPYWLWTLMAIPAVLWSYMAITADSGRVIHQLLHPTGEWSARLLIFTLMITPLAMLFGSRGWTRWLRKNRRYFGVAAFGYAALHTVLYLIDEGSLRRIIGDLDDFYIWTGWVAFVIFVPLAMTSMDFFVRKMGTWWKWLQRWTYVAAVFTLLHWAALHNWGGLGPALVHFAPLTALEIYRLTRTLRRRSATAPA